MAIDFSKFGVKAETKPTGLDFSALSNLKKTPDVRSSLPISETTEPKTKVSYISDFLGGGAYTTIIGKPNELVKTERTDYGGVEAKKGYERADIVPVSLGGINTEKKNIKYQAIVSKAPGELTKADKYLKDVVLPKYKSGEWSLPQARNEILAFQQREELEAKGVKQGVLENLPSAVKETVGGFLKGMVSIFGEAATSVKNMAQSVEDITAAPEDKTTAGQIKSSIAPLGIADKIAKLATAFITNKTASGAKTVPDRSEQTMNIPWLGETKPLITGKETPVEAAKKVTGAALEIAPYFMGLPEGKALIATTETIGKKAIRDITAKEFGKFSLAYATQLAKSSGLLGTMFGGGASLREGADARQTAINIAKSIGTIALLEATLSPILKFGLGKVAEGVKTDKATGKPVEGVKTVKEAVDTVLKENEPIINAKIDEIKASQGIPTEPAKLVDVRSELPTAETAPVVSTNVRANLEEAIAKNAPETIEQINSRTDNPYSTGSQRTAEKIQSAGGQEVIATVGDKQFEIGNWGKSHQTNKALELKGDRFDVSRVGDVIKTSKEQFRGSNDPTNYRYDNIAWVGELDGKPAVVYTRLNTNGVEEVINWHKINETKNPNYISTLRSYGSPTGIRTQIYRLERGSPNPLTDRATTNVSKNGPKVKTEASRAPLTEPVKPATPETKLESSVFERLKEEHPEALTGVTEYTKINLKEDAAKAVELVSKDKEQAYRVAMGAEEAPKGQTSTAVNIALAEKALEEGNHSLYTQLVKNRSLEQTRRGQEIVAEKGSVSDNSTSRYVKELLNTRLKALGKKYLSDLTGKVLKKTDAKRAIEVIDREVKKAKEKISAKRLDIKEAQALIDRLACK